MMSRRYVYQLRKQLRETRERRFRGREIVEPNQARARDDQHHGTGRAENIALESLKLGRCRTTSTDSDLIAGDHPGVTSITMLGFRQSKFKHIYGQGVKKVRLVLHQNAY
jgi:hypothetical protein